MELASWVYKKVYRFDHQNLETNLVNRCGCHSRFPHLLDLYKN